MMRGRTSWVNYRQIGGGRDKDHYNVNTEPTDDKDAECPAISMDSILSDDLLEYILASLPIASVFRASSVCKRWNEMVKSCNFSRSSSQLSPQIPWYFMFTSSDNPSGYAFDPTLRKWYSMELPCIERSNWLVSSSNGLVAFMDNDGGSKLNVCNPITRCCRKLVRPPGSELSDYCALALSVGSSTKPPNYTVSVVKSKQVQGNFFDWEFSIHLYDSDAKTWVDSSMEVVSGWRSGNESVICAGTLYFLIYAIGGGLGLMPRSRHGLVTYSLTERSSRGSLDKNIVPVPCPLTCGRLMNLRERLVLVGGIGRQGRGDVIIRGVGIWVLNSKDEWQEITRMPNKFFQGCGGFDEVFASGGTDDVVYIHSYGSPALLMFNMRNEQWKLSTKCPVTKKFPLQLFNGFCFEPRLGIAP